MASVVIPAIHSYVAADVESDYGSDFSPEEEEIVNKLIASPQSLEEGGANPIITASENDSSHTLRLPRVLGRGRGQEESVYESENTDQLHYPIRPVNSIYPNLSGNIVSGTPHINDDLTGSATREQAIDTRSPIERFRTAPKKTLSVTDLVSPAWCELQYWYTLKIHGRKKQTIAMKQGTSVHKDLEDQLYTTVKIDIATKEDAWGLRIWNVIQGLRTLQEIGHTRELEIWGVVDGLVVNGVLDQLSFTCPDADLETDLEIKTSTGKQLPKDHKIIPEYFNSSEGMSNPNTGQIKRRAQSKKVYICDVKTRAIRTLPKGGAFRPTKMQLMLYHHLLSNLATDRVDFSILLRRHELDGAKTFSDSFIAQIRNLNDSTSLDLLQNPPSSSDPPSTQDSMNLLLAHNSLTQLWSLMIRMFQKVLPDGKDSVGNVLTAEYRSRDRGEVLGSSTLAMDEDLLSAYLNHALKWWKGEREPNGVVIEEAYKCRSCDYANICDWRLQKVEDAKEKMRTSRSARMELQKWDAENVTSA